MNLIHTTYQPPGNSPFPTILTLHGRGANAFDLLGLAPYLCGGQFLIICPQAPTETPIGPDQVGYAWYGSSKGGVPDTDGMLESQKALQLFLDDCLKQYPIDPKRFAVLGFSQGGVMAYSLALTNPERFAGLAALSTWLPRELTPRLNYQRRRAIAANVNSTWHPGPADRSRPRPRLGGAVTRTTSAANF